MSDTGSEVPRGLGGLWRKFFGNKGGSSQVPEAPNSPAQPSDANNASKRPVNPFVGRW